MTELRIISREQYVGDDCNTESLWDSLPLLSDVREVCEALISGCVSNHIAPYKKTYYGCKYCSRGYNERSGYIRHKDDCIIKKAKSILEQIGG